MVKDSGKRVEYESGMRRDTDDGKPLYTLIDPAYLKRWAIHMAEGAKKYGKNNWQLANSPEEMERFRESAARHFMSWLNGETDEDHAVAVAFNIAAWERLKLILEVEKPEPELLTLYGVCRECGQSIHSFDPLQQFGYCMNVRCGIYHAKQNWESVYAPSTE